jgi:hypothetical protein
MKWCYEGCERGLGSPRYSRSGDRRYTFYWYITRRSEELGLTQPRTGSWQAAWYREAVAINSAIDSMD